MSLIPVPREPLAGRMPVQLVLPERDPRVPRVPRVEVRRVRVEVRRVRVRVRQVRVEVRRVRVEVRHEVPAPVGTSGAGALTTSRVSEATRTSPRANTVLAAELVWRSRKQVQADELDVAAGQKQALEQERAAQQDSTEARM